MITGEVKSVERQPVQSELSAPAAAGAMSLAVEFAEGNFNEDGGQFLLNGNLLDYASSDAEADTLSLVAPLPVAAEQGDPVQSLVGGKPAVEWVAQVSRDEGDAVPATIPTGLIPHFPEGTDAYAVPMPVQLTLDEDGEFEVHRQLSRDASIDGGAVWNPHVYRDMLAATIPPAVYGYSQVTAWLPGEADGITAGAGYTVVYAGVYFIAAQVAFQASAVGARRLRLLNNGVQVAFMAQPGDTETFTYVQASTELRLAEQDVITVEVWQSSGADLDLMPGLGVSNFKMHRVSV